MEKRAKSLTLEEQLKKLEHENETLKALVRWYEGQFRLAQRQRFGSSSEKTHPDQLSLFNEAEAESDPAKEEPTLETVMCTRKKHKGQRDIKLKNLRTERVEHRLVRSRRALAAAVRCTK